MLVYQTDVGANVPVLTDRDTLRSSPLREQRDNRRGLIGDLNNRRATDDYAGTSGRCSREMRA